ncbi:MAG: hypothetical protein AB9M53_01175 [Leptothrix sp. (in: b-proteobacteria)]
MAAPRQDPGPKPTDDSQGCVPGDEVYLCHKRGPVTARVLASGMHGVTVDVNGRTHKVKHEHVLGHKRRARMDLQVVEHGEDGIVVQTADGRRQYVAVPPEAREDQMVIKSLDGSRLVFLKGMAPRPGLTEKKITDKNGVQTTRWVSANGAPASVGHHVGFANGEHKGHGQVFAAGKDGVTVRDGAGGAHRVPHDKVTHRWEGEGAPDHSPHEQDEPLPQRPDWAPRNEGEKDKDYAKRVVDKGPSVDKLPEKHDHYFNTKGSQHVSLDKLHSSKSAEENTKGGDNGPKRMLAAAHGALGKRDPITVMPHETEAGHFDVVDGNGTLTSAQNMGWKGLPTKQVSREEGKVLMLEDKISDAVKAAKMHELFGDEASQSLPAKVSSKFKSWDDLAAAGGEAQKAFEDLMGNVAKSLGATNVGDLGKHDHSKPGIVFGIGPMKTQESATRKATQKYGGDFSKLGDLVRGSIGFDSVDELRDGIEKLKAAGLKLATKPDNKFVKPTDAGYRDMNLNFVMPNGVVGELQLHLKPILAAKAEGHKDYEMTRLLDAKAKNDPPLTEEEDKDLQSRLLKQRTLYGTAMQKALGGAGNGEAKTLTKALSGRIILVSKARK